MNIPKQLVDLPPDVLIPFTVGIKKFESCRSRDGMAFSLDLYIDDKKAAEVQDGGCGGMVDFYWLDEPSQTRWAEWVKSLPEYQSELNPELGSIDYNDDMAIELFINALSLRQWLQRNSRNKTIFQLHSEPLGSIRTVNRPFSADIRGRMTAKYGDNINFFADELLGKVAS